MTHSSDARIIISAIKTILEKKLNDIAQNECLKIYIEFPLGIMCGIKTRIWDLGDKKMREKHPYRADMLVIHKRRRNEEWIDIRYFGTKKFNGIKQELNRVLIEDLHLNKGDFSISSASAEKRGDYEPILQCLAFDIQDRYIKSIELVEIKRKINDREFMTAIGQVLTYQKALEQDLEALLKDNLKLYHVSIRKIIMLPEDQSYNINKLLIDTAKEGGIDIDYFKMLEIVHEACSCC